MKRLHDKELLEIKVIDYLFTRKNNWVITQEIKDSLKIGSTALHRILDDLPQHLCLENIDLIISKNKGVKIICGDNYPLKKIFESIYTSSLEYKIIIAHFNETYISLTNFAIENYISTATLQRKIRKINRLTSVYNIYLKRGKIEGDEEAVRKFIFTYFWNIHSSNKLNTLNTPEGEKFLAFLEETTGLTLTQVGKEKFLLYHSITHLREKRKNHLNSISKNIELVSQFSNYFDGFHKKFNYLYDERGINLRFLLFAFLAFQDNYHNNSILSSDKLYKALVINFRQYKKKLKVPIDEIEDSILINYLVIDFERKLNLSYNKLEKIEILLEAFSMCWQGHIMLLELFEETFFTCTKKIKEEFPLFVDELDTLIPTLHEKISKKILLEALCAISLKMNINIKLGEIFYITIILIKGEIYEDIIKELLKRTLSYKYTLKYLPKNRSEKADLIITDFPQLVLENNDLLFIQNDTITVKDMVTIDRLLSEKQKKLQYELVEIKVSESNINN